MTVQSSIVIFLRDFLIKKGCNYFDQERQAKKQKCEIKGLSNMEEIKVGIIGMNHHGQRLVNILGKLDQVRLQSVADTDLTAPGVKMAISNQIEVYKSYEAMIKKEALEVVIDLTFDRHTNETIAKFKSNQTLVINYQAAQLLIEITKGKDDIYQIQETEKLLQTILDSTHEGVQVANKEGKVLYVNKAFERITKVPPEDRIGKSVFEVSPDGALSEVLKHYQPVYGKPNTVKPSNVQVLSNASPIYIDGSLTGAVVVFRDVTDVKRAYQKVKESEKVIDDLKGGIKNLASARYTFEDLCGQSELINEQINIAKQAAKTNSTILLTGESGTGKELFAHAIHNYSDIKEMPFIKVNCATIPENLLESELFGHEKGAFTGADKKKIGKLEIADGGTVFLDEIGDMSFNLQAKLLRVLQEGEIERVGSATPFKVNLRIIAATNRDIEKMVVEGAFREDLYYRLNIIHIHLPPLRSREEDIPELIKSILRKKARKFGRAVNAVEPEAVQLMQNYSWPGNVRELENILERAVTLGGGHMIKAAQIRPYLQISENDEGETEIESLDELEKRAIQAALDKYGMHLEGKKKAALKLNISLATLYNKIKKHRLYSCIKNGPKKNSAQNLVNGSNNFLIENENPLS